LAFGVFLRAGRAVLTAVLAARTWHSAPNLGVQPPTAFDALIGCDLLLPAHDDRHVMAPACRMRPASSDSGVISDAEL
jgi:hypothetical protein